MVLHVAASLTAHLSESVGTGQFLCSSSRGTLGRTRQAVVKPATGASFRRAVLAESRNPDSITLDLRSECLASSVMPGTFATSILHCRTRQVATGQLPFQQSWNTLCTDPASHQQSRTFPLSLVPHSFPKKVVLLRLRRLNADSPLGWRGRRRGSIGIVFWMACTATEHSWFHGGRHVWHCKWAPAN